MSCTIRPIWTFSTYLRCRKHIPSVVDASNICSSASHRSFMLFTIAEALFFALTSFPQSRKRFFLSWHPSHNRGNRPSPPNHPSHNRGNRPLTARSSFPQSQKRPLTAQSSFPQSRKHLHLARPGRLFSIFLSLFLYYPLISPFD